jgi:hypothetical protein
LNFDHQGYPLTFVQKRLCRDNSAHLFTLIYKFYSPATKYTYILHADYHEENVFALKFYAKKDRHSDYKYSILTNKGDIGNILITCLKVIPIILYDYPTAFFGFIGSRTFDKASNTVENLENNQRFRVYKHIVQLKIGSVQFRHFIYEDISGYLLINMAAGSPQVNEKIITRMFSDTYENLPDL